MTTDETNESSSNVATIGNTDEGDKTLTVVDDDHPKTTTDSSGGSSCNSSSIPSTSTSTSSSSSTSTSYCSSILYCNCRHPILCKDCGQPHTDRDHTQESVQHLINGQRPALTNVYGNGPILLSHIPESSAATIVSSPTNNKKEDDHHGVVLGIDEAGRGSVIGPMVYGCAFWSSNPAIESTIPKDFNDSKQLSDDKREKLWNKIVNHDHIGYCVRSILPSEISRNMLRKSTDIQSLNEQSHDAAMVMIRKVVNAGVHVTRAYIDTVGNPEYYKRKLTQEFPTIQFIVESKADAKYAPCSAASVVAKVLRDRMLIGWKYSEPQIEEFGTHISKRQYGSGYPSDPICKDWINSIHDPVFGYCDIVRFSWAPCKNRLSGENKDEEGHITNSTTTVDAAAAAAKVTFLADLDEEEEENFKQSKGMAQFLTNITTGKAGTGNGDGSCTLKRKRSAYFDRRKIRVTKSVI